MSDNEIEDGDKDCYEYDPLMPECFEYRRLCEAIGFTLNELPEHEVHRIAADIIEGKIQEIGPITDRSGEFTIGMIVGIIMMAAMQMLKSCVIE